jgi:RHS repeat-associated protein
VAATVTPTSAPLALTNEKAPKNGYVYVYVSNRSDQDVYFDNLKVGITAGNIIEENHYYAFGLKIAAISSKKLGDAAEGKLKNPYQYNDKEMLDEDADLNWYDYGFRNYDPQIGRFMQLDPLTDDYPELTPFQYGSCDPITNIDIDGLEGGVSTLASGAEDVFHNTLNAVVIIGHPVSAASKTAKGMSTAARIGLIVARGASDALANANTIGMYDLFGGNHTSSYEDPQDQAAYLRGRLAGDIAAGAQATTEINAGGGAALATAVETGGVGLLAGGVVALHGAGVGAIATADAAKTLKLLYQLNITAKDGENTPEQSSQQEPAEKNATKQADKTALPALDATGKVHGVLPKAKDFGKYPKEELKVLLTELKQSVKKRIKVTSKMGRDRTHGQRQGAEQDLIKSLEKYLSK